MPKMLIIAEKPSVAADLARVLGRLPEIGKFEKKKDYFENDHAYLSSAIGHLVELKMPSGPGGKKLPWGMKHLPIIPQQFELQPIEKTETRFKLLQRLLKKNDVDTVVNACDAGREGELIFRYLLQMADVKKDLTIKRMWMQSMTDDAILQAWHEMRNEDEMRPLANAALCRSESDWLVGLNGTRALTAYNSRNGGFNVTTAGRVQTPTLVILAEREREIRAFQPQTYWEVLAQFAVTQGEYGGRWFNEEFEKSEAAPQARAERIWSQAEAEAIVARCQGQTGTIEESKKPQKQAPPLLFDLTSLQREAGNKFGFSAQRTLQLAQACYDRHKLLTYPRTDSKYLPEDYLKTVRQTVAGFAKQSSHPAFAENLANCSKWILDNDRVVPSKRIFNSAKVSDHFAIIPTGKMPQAKLDDGALKLFQLVVRRFLAIFYPNAEFELTRRVTRIQQDSFLTSGRILVAPGYLEVYGRTAGSRGDHDELVAVQDGQAANVVSIEAQQNETRPPARYNDSTLLSAMETAGKRVDDGELREAMSERGLGTPATRAAIIENLIRQKYVFRHEQQHRDLVVSNKGLALVDLLHEIGITTLGSPEMTGEWEYKLKQIEHGNLDRTDFMDEIKSLTTRIVEETRKFTDQVSQRSFDDLRAPCPECGGGVHRQTDGLFECYNPECRFKLKKHIASYELTPEDAGQLLTHRQLGPIEGFKNRFGQPFAAELRLEKNKKAWKVDFVFEGDNLRDEELKSLTDERVICEVPGNANSTATVKVYETEKAFVAPDLATDVDPKGIRISKTILQKVVPTEQGIKLFVEGKTDLMPGFVSKKGRKFAAHLKLDRVTGKLEFEFAPRTPRKSESSESDSPTPKQVAKKKTSKKTAVRKKTAKKTAKK